MASCQLYRIPKVKEHTDLDRGVSRKGGNHFPVRVHRMVAFELVLFTCCRSVTQTLIILHRVDSPAHLAHSIDYIPLPMLL